MPGNKIGRMVVSVFRPRLHKFAGDLGMQPTGGCLMCHGKGVHLYFCISGSLEVVSTNLGAENLEGFGPKNATGRGREVDK